MVYFVAAKKLSAKRLEVLEGNTMRKNLVSCIIGAVEKGKLKEPFDAEDVKKVCPGFALPTYKSTLVHHRKGNPIKQSEHFERNDAGKYTLVRKQ
jgi:hypothetical protein